MTTIIFAHPWHGSFNKAILDSITKKLIETQENYTVLDLYKENFNPVLDEANLSIFTDGESYDQQVKKFQLNIMNSNKLIFIFPIWWSTMPAILKGFLDKVLLKNFAYKVEKWNIKGLLTNLEEATIITTCEAPNLYIKTLGRKGIVILKTSLKSVGVKKVNWYNCGSVKKISQSKREKFLELIKEKI